MKLIVPTSLSDITISNFKKYQKVMSADDITDDIQKLALVTIFCNITLSEARTISTKDINEIAGQIKTVLEFRPVFKQRFTLDGIEYGFIPNLDQMSAGEYIDLDALFMDEELICDAMAILYRPIKNKKGNLYTIQSYNDVYLNGIEKHKEIMQNASLDVVLGAKVFFYTLSNELLTATIQYLSSQKGKEQEMQADSTLNGAGINQSIQYLTEISTNLKKQLNYLYIPSLLS